LDEIEDHFRFPGFAQELCLLRQAGRAFTVIAGGDQNRNPRPPRRHALRKIEAAAIARHPDIGDEGGYFGRTSFEKFDRFLAVGSVNDTHSALEYKFGCQYADDAIVFYNQDELLIVHAESYTFLRNSQRGIVAEIQ
jgi:hypothetical protein